MDSSMFTDPFFVIGLAFLLFIVIFVTIILTAISLGKGNLGRKKKTAPRYVLWVILTFYQPLRLVLHKLGKDRRVINDIGIDIMNHLYAGDYSKVPMEDRIMVLPHCLRDQTCPAKTDPVDGLICLHCGKCGISDIVKFSEEAGIKSYVTNGSSFVKRVVKKYRPGAVYGVACTRDLFEVMRYVNAKGVPMIGTKLLRDGCVNTEVDWDHVKIGLVLTPGTLEQF